jgi:hypothetical protein
VANTICYQSRSHIMEAKKQKTIASEEKIWVEKNKIYIIYNIDMSKEENMSKEEQ